MNNLYFNLKRLSLNCFAKYFIYEIKLFSVGIFGIIHLLRHKIFQKTNFFAPCTYTYVWVSGEGGVKFEFSGKCCLRTKRMILYDNQINKIIAL